MKNRNAFHALFLVLLLSLLLFSCKSTQSTQQETAAATQASTPRLPDWHKNATLYEVNIRQFTPEGTFASFQQHLPRLKDMGVDILWLMPIHPVSKARRKGSLGSPYAVGDYYDVNPRFGSMEDFEALLAAIHDLDMRCIIDWVPNHTGWDNPWITEHPEYYTQKDGEITDPINPRTGESWGWTDVADLNYDNPDTRQAMIDAMQFWIADIGIDGFRVDVAHGVPEDFWAQCKDSLYAIKPLFMLAEAEVPALRNMGAFVMDYGWEMHHLLNQIAKTQGANLKEGVSLEQGNVVEGNEKKLLGKNALDIDKILAKKAQAYQQGYAMHFTSNHDENSWSGTEFQRMGASHKAFAVLTATFDGMPLIYTGQEAAMDKRLAFFEKDEVPWGEYAYADFYKKLFRLKHRNQALWNGNEGGELVKIPTGNDKNIYAFTREKNRDQVVVVINLSSQKQTFELQGEGFAGDYLELFSEEDVTLQSPMAMELAPWAYRVFFKDE
jgi:alpha-amylase